MQNVIYAAFDPTVFSSRKLSDLTSFIPLKQEVIYRDFPRLTTAHLALRVPIVLATAANIRKYDKAGAFPNVNCIYYDPFTRFFSVPHPIKQKQTKFLEILNRTPTDAEMVRYFKRLHNLAKSHYTRPTEHSHTYKARPISGVEKPAEFEVQKQDQPSTSTSTPKPQRELNSFKEPRFQKVGGRMYDTVLGIPTTPSPPTRRRFTCDYETCSETDTDSETDSDIDPEAKIQSCLEQPDTDFARKLATMYLVSKALEID